MITLGIESTAHTFGVGIVKDKVVLANERKLFTTEKGGIIPINAAQHHYEHCHQILKAALEKAKIKIADIDLIAFSQGPGIGHCLKVGAAVAQSLHILTGKPLIGVNHCVAHLEIGSMQTPATDPVLLYASGANTQIIAYEGRKYRIFGETLDIGIGNFLDTFARDCGLGFPGGPLIEKLAIKGSNLVDLPYSVKGMDVSFSGLLTKLKQLHKQNKYSIEDLSYSCQETAFAMLVECAERALAHCGKKELLLGGGVACNKRFQEMAHKMCEERGAVCYVLENQFNVDNAAMIAWTGSVMYNAGQQTKIEDSKTKPYQRTDDILVTWK